MQFSLALAALLPAAAVLAAPAPMPTPPGIPTAASAKTQLAALTVSTNADDGLYQRDLFPTWITIEGTCNTREYVLKRDGTSVVVGSDCYPTSGTWTSPYDGGESGANKWTTAKRQQFANDVTRPQLWAVTDNVNQSKGDKSPDAWKPPLASFYCVYARSWVQVKTYWALSITSAEKSALTTMLNTC
ncbi:hypothetical protein CIB48_g4472 [Xylaria polymorpha]|nr:hypothetical protein CIB48_g4472 [Xylaria polymorpha]